MLLLDLRHWTGLEQTSNGWTEENPPRLERIDSIVKFGRALIFWSSEPTRWARTVSSDMTKDIDLWLQPTVENAARLMEVLEDVRLPELAPSADEWTNEKSMIQLGSEPYRVDLLNFATGVEFTEA